MANTKNVLRFIIIFQYIPRLVLIFPLSSQIIKATGVVTETAWAGAAYNLMLYMLASHVSTKKHEKCALVHRLFFKNYLWKKLVAKSNEKDGLTSFILPEN